MKVLITGATGFLGGKLAQRLHSMGYRVTAVGRNKAKGMMLEDQGIRFIQVDLSDAQAIMSLCKGQDYVFHSAALSSPWGKYQDFYSANVAGTRNLIAGCEQHQIKRLIHVSTPSIYFDFTDRYNIKETDPLPEKPINHYAATKLLAEKEIETAFKNGLAVISIRPRALFGPDDTALFPRLLKANDTVGIPIVDGASALVDITYVENVVDALILCMTAPQNALGKKYNITNGEPLALIYIFEEIFRKLGKTMHRRNISYKNALRIAKMTEVISSTLLFGKEPVITCYSIGVLAKSQTLNIEAAKKDLGYTPRISIAEGLDLFVADWRKKNHD